MSNLRNTLCRVGNLFTGVDYASCRLLILKKGRVALSDLRVNGHINIPVIAEGWGRLGGWGVGGREGGAGGERGREGGGGGGVFLHQVDLTCSSVQSE